ncbi:hypothetical protein [Brachybacterium massiliense]|uniref:hypothetical protein n=1 Tax=Brachybacterium massiliense TaxID=1755098 RepID=UPI001FE3B021|nr:hypothetical protein [Brachybacterium massiliense]
MEINPYESRLRMLQQIDGVQMQREAAPDEETAGCPGCPYFWTCPVPHRGEEVRAPEEIDRADVPEQLGARREFSPRDESDVGWTDEWVGEDGLPLEAEEIETLRAQQAQLAQQARASREHPEELSGRHPAEVSRSGSWRRLFRRRR